ncbi:MAG: aminopeptidase P family N-terminal domain-containing protein, partial [Faecalimonas sp.]
MSVTDRIAKLRKLMEERKMDAYIIPSADNHQSEYVGEHFKARAFISGFTGSAGTVIITKDDAGLWTDGRYFIQAEKQLEGSGIRLFRMAEPDVPTKEEYLESVLPDHGVLGFDGKVIGASEGQNYEEVLKEKAVSISYDEDLISYIWEDRPALSNAPAFLLDLAYAGESTASKLERLREKMQEADTTVHILSSLDDIAWLLNIRGGDVMYTP